MAPKHIPLRTCVGCRQIKPKRDMMRIVRTPEGQVEIDPTGKKSGRGAYLCLKRSCWEIALQKKRLDHALKTRLTLEEEEMIRKFAQSLPEEELQGLTWEDKARLLAAIK